MEYDIEKILTMYEDDYTPAIGPRAMVGEITDQQTKFGRPIYQTPEGEKVSEKSTTLFFNGDWMNVPSIHGGKSFNEDELRLMIKRGNLQPTSIHKSKADAEAAAKARSDSMVPGPRNMNQGGRIGFKKKGFVESKYSKYTPSVYDNLTPDMKNYYEEITGKKWNKKDWDEGNYRRVNKSRKAKDVIKKPQKMTPYQKKVGFFTQFKINQRMLADEAKLAKKGYISARKLNELLGRANTESSIDDLKRVIDGDRASPWLNEKEGVSKWKKSKNFSFIDRSIGGQKFYKMPNETTLNSMKNYYKNQEFLSDAKYGRIKDPSIKGAKIFYEDKALLNAIKKWSGSSSVLEMDKNALKVLNSVFGSDNWQGPNAIKNLGRALVGDIKIEGIKKDVALGKKILEGVTRTANSKLGGSTWDQAAYVYARENMENLFKNNKGKGFKRLYDDIEKSLIKILGNKRGKVAIDEVLSLRTGLTNDAQVYSVFSQVIDKKVNENFKKSYDANLSKNFKKIREEIAKGAEADLDKIKGWTDQQNIKLAEAKKKYPNIKFANLGKFNYETGKFATPEETFGSKRFADLPSDIQKRIRKDFRTSGISVDVGGAGTQKEVISDLKHLTQKELLKKLEKLGCGQAAGGRILFSQGTPGGTPTKCARKGLGKFMDNLKKGNYSKATLDVLKGGGNVLKNIVNPKELLKLRNLIGPAALGFMAAWEGGVITNDVINKGTPLNEALASNWLTKTFLPYTQEYAKAKNLLETGKVPSNMKKYVQDVMQFQEVLKDMEAMENKQSGRLTDVGGYGMIDDTSSYTLEQEQKDQDNIIEKMTTMTENVFDPRSKKALDMQKLITENEATRLAKKEWNPFFGFDKLKDVRTEAPMVIPDYMDVPDPKEVDLRPITYMDAEYQDQRLPLGIEQALMNKYGLKPRDSLSNYYFKGSDRNILEEVTDEYNKYQRQEQASQYPGYWGTQYSEGGIASINVKKS